VNWLVDLFGSTSVAGSVLILGLVAALGLILGAVQVRGIKLGIAGVLFAGLLFGHLGATLAPPVLEFARDLGLILFVYAVGIEVGPGFLPSLRQHGLWLNLTAAAVVAAGAVLAMMTSRLLGIEMPVAAGMFSGATTNTPSLGAAQAALHQLPSYTDSLGELPGLGYAVTYPFGVLGIIFSMIAVRGLFPKAAAEPAGDRTGPATADPPAQPERLDVLPIFLGISLGVLLGSLPVSVSGLPVPLRLGLAGGPLIVAIVLGAVGRIGPLSWRLPAAAADLMREFGIVLFLACVGIRSGGGFVRTVTQGDGLHWMALGAVITLAPLLIAVVVSRLLIRTSYASACGLLAGSMTNPASLAFAISTTHSEETTLAYATVYPLTMVLRVIAAQLIVLLLAR
jgi:AspT/YidE/YbjL antiporter-like protein